LFLRDYDDPLPRRIHTHLLSIRLDWSNKGNILAVGGHRLESSASKHAQQTQQAAGQPYYINSLQFYCGRTGILKYNLELPFHQAPITALTWGHNDKRLFIASGYVLHTAWITKH